jgi:predicted RNase H-like nuclease
VNAPRRYALGLDGCRRGWVGVRLDLDHAAPPAARFYRSFGEVLVDPDRPAAIVIDIPIGFLDVATPGGRLCERLTRQKIGERRSSVFSAPTRAALAHPGDYRTAHEANRGEGETGISQQCFRLIPKLNEVDSLMTPALQARVRESHPELAFTVLNGGQPMRFSKKKAPGRADRIAVLESAWGRYGMHRQFLDPRLHPGLSGGGVARDDLVDAAVMALVAVRVVRGEAVAYPSDPPRDAKGLRMEIVV